MRSESSNNNLLTSVAAANLLGLKPQTLRLWRLQGKGPRYIRLGDSQKARVAYFESDIHDWLNRRTYSSTSEETALQGAA